MAIDPMVAALAAPLHELRESLGTGGDISAIIAALTGTSTALDDYTATARTSAGQLGDQEVFIGQSGTAAADHVVSGGTAAGGLAGNMDKLPPILTGANAAMTTARTDMDAIIAGFESLGTAPPAQLHSAQGMSGVIAAAAGATRAALGVIGTAETAVADAVRQLGGIAPPAVPGAVSPAVTAAGYVPQPGGWQPGQLGAAGYNGTGYDPYSGTYSPYGANAGMWSGGASTDPTTAITSALVAAGSTVIEGLAEAAGTVVDHVAEGIGTGIDHVVDAGTTMVDHAAGDGAQLVDHAMTGAPLPSATGGGATGTGGGLFGGGAGAGAGGGAPSAPLFGPAPAAPPAGTTSDPITGGGPAAPPPALPKPPVPPPAAPPAAPAPVRHHPAAPPPPATETGDGTGDGHDQAGTGAGTQVAPNLGGGQSGLGDDTTRRNTGTGTGGGGQAGMADGADANT